MYKKQLRFQRIICYAAMISGALSFVYSLGFVTDLYDSFYYTIPNPNKLEKTYVSGSRIYYDVQAFNKLLLYASIVLLLLGVFLFLTQTHARRKYYVGNYISTALFGCGAVAYSAWSFTQVSAYKTQYLTTIDFSALEKYSQMMPSIKNIQSTLWFDLQYALAGLLIIVTILLVVNIIWKIQLMRAEAQLIAENAK